MPDSIPSSGAVRPLIVCGVASWLLYLGLLWMSEQFVWGTSVAQRPILAAVTVFAILFGLYVFAVRFVLRNEQTTGLLPVIVVFAIAFRLVLLFSQPILEIDAYRYLWDGKACAAGVSPYRFSPQQVLDANVADNLPSDLAVLVRLRDRSSSNQIILSRIHYSSLTTVYPPVSQTVFACTALVTPQEASVTIHLLILKVVVVLFDLGTLWLMIALLKTVNRPPELSLLYGWCPLVLKEFANSGHLDAIAVFLTTATVVLAIRAFFSIGKTQPVRLWLCGLFAVISVGAKIYPVILFPLLVWSAWKRFRGRTTITVTVCTSLLSMALLIPMLTREPPAPASVVGGTATTDEDDSAVTGIAAFTTRWQMNDFLFMLFYENLRPDREVTKKQTPPSGAAEMFPRADAPVNRIPEPSQETDQPDSSSDAVVRRVWFAIVPNTWRRSLTVPLAAAIGTTPKEAAFLVTRIVLSLAFLAFTIRLAQRASSVENTNGDVIWLESVFLTIAWFWLLLPTQNPWYWVWVMPFLPFARSRAWITVSGCTMIYYVRFWFVAHNPQLTVHDRMYSGTQLFDFYITWLEFLPVLLWLLTDKVRSAFHRARQCPVW